MDSTPSLLVRSKVTGSTNVITVSGPPPSSFSPLWAPPKTVKDNYTVPTNIDIVSYPENNQSPTVGLRTRHQGPNPSVHRFRRRYITRTTDRERERKDRTVKNSEGGSIISYISGKYRFIPFPRHRKLDQKVRIRIADLSGLFYVSVLSLRENRDL